MKARPWSNNGLRRGRKVGILHLPEFTAGARVIAVGRLGAAAEHLGLAGNGDDQRRAVGLAQIPFLRHLARHVLVVPRRRAIRFPDRLAGLFVERDMVLQIGAVHGQDQQVLERDRRRRRAAVMAAAQIVPLPKHLARFRVQARGPETAKMDVNPARLNYRRWRGVAIHRSAVAERFRIIAVKDLFVEANLAGVALTQMAKKS